MSQNVFILGAGASKEAGAPVMDDFLDKARELYSNGEVEEFKEDFKIVFKAISELQPIHSKSELDIYNIESVFAAFEMGKLINKLPGISNREINKLIKSMRKIIYATLNKTTYLEVTKRFELPQPNDSYNALIKLIKDLKRQNSIDSSIITFNYDLALDYSIYKHGLLVNYCLGENERQSNINLMKLHGSLNWFTYLKKRIIIPLYFDIVLKDVGVTKIFPHNVGDYYYFDPLKILSGVNFVYQGEKVKSETFIVPPTWNKTEYHAGLSKVWSQAAVELSEAKNIFICGYSLPETDYFFRYLFALGTVGKTILERLWVFDPNEEVKSRFIKFIGSGIRKRFKFEPYKFTDTIKHLRKIFLNSQDGPRFVAL